MPEKSEQLEIGSTHKGKRVEIYLEVNDKGAIRKESIPFSVGVLASLAGDKQRTDSFKVREVHEIDRENFDDVVQRISPEIHLSVDNVLSSDPKAPAAFPKNKLGGTLRFSSMDDFEPQNVARQIPELDALLEERKTLLMLLRRLQINSKFADRIRDAFEDPEKRLALLQELGMVK